MSEEKQFDNAISYAQSCVVFRQKGRLGTISVQTPGVDEIPITLAGGEADFTYVDSNVLKGVIALAFSAGQKAAERRASSSQSELDDAIVFHEKLSEVLDIDPPDAAEVYNDASAWYSQALSTAKDLRTAASKPPPMESQRHGLTLEEFARVNVDRATACFPECSDWTPLEWAGALAGEVGELANLLKKMRRGEAVDRQAVSDELGDVYTYLDLVANSVDTPLEYAVVRKFNVVSERRKAKQYIVPRDEHGRVDWARVPDDWVVDSDAPGAPHPPWHYPGVESQIGDEP